MAHQQVQAVVDRKKEVSRAVDAMRRGEFVVVFDDESRENEGDLFLAAEYMTEAAMVRLLSHTSGVVAVALPEERATALGLPQMTDQNTGLHETAFTISVDLKEGGTTGISARERAATVRALAAASTRPDDLARPGHVFPIRAVAGGVRVRDGHTEAAVELSRLAGLSGVTAICEIVRPDWSMARHEDLERLAAREGFPLISVRDLVLSLG